MRIWLVLFLTLPNRQCRAVEVTQKDKLLLVHLGASTEIHCSQDQSTHLNMYWYQHKPREGMKLMVWSSNAKEEKMEADYEARWNLHRPDIYTSALSLKGATREDSAQYFCASQSITDGDARGTPGTKPLDKESDGN
ncbi:hypothetical protein GDO86_020206 [Hymenochirus boettgeri]|uniref:Ig-like domain-containing protein n=1 Tax=Hymenochirus boettgeri TaxID=247094 RepID=A0A8T2IJC4_9PIPI|nr:hypothetical protein GDO86_020206 [Hymenochirus boettgeri]